MLLCMCKSENVPRVLCWHVCVKINYYKHNIHISITIQPRGNEVYWIDFLCFLTAFISSLGTAGCWQLSSTVHCEAFGCSWAKGQWRQRGQLFSQNQHLFYLTMIWLGLHGNCSGNFLSPMLNPVEVVQHVTSEEWGDFEELSVCALEDVWLWGRERSCIQPRSSPV